MFDLVKIDMIDEDFSKFDFIANKTTLQYTPSLFHYT